MITNELQRELEAQVEKAQSEEEVIATSMPYGEVLEQIYETDQPV
jgi:hypothetical protein